MTFDCSHGGSAHQGSQDDSLRLFSILQEPARAEPSQAPHHHPQGRAIHPSHSYPGVHVRGRGKRCPGKL